MKSNLHVAALLALAVVGISAGCSPKTSDNSDISDTNVSRTASNDLTTAANMVNSNSVGTNTMNADNSGVNVRDRDTNNLTPGDQGNSAADIDLTQKIRKAVVGDANYSMTAKNIKIITVDGKVTLRGPVNTDAEKSGIETLATNIAGAGNVNNQLEVKTNP